MKTTFHLAPDDGERSMIIRSLNNLRSSLISPLKIIRLRKERVLKKKNWQRA